MKKENIIIFRDSLLPSSETFIKGQAEKLRNFTPYFAGYKKMSDGLELPIKQVIVSSNTKAKGNTIKEIFYKTTSLDYRFYNKLKTMKPSLIHAHFGPDGLIALPIAKKLNIPLLVTFHGYDATVKDEYLMKQSFNVRQYVKHRDKLIKGGTYFIAVSNFIKAKLLEKGFPEEKIITHYIGIDQELLIPDRSIDRENIVLFVGRLVENKGCNYLLKAMKIVQKKNPHVSLVVIGEGPQKEKLQLLANSELQNVTFLGKQPYQEVIKWMNKAKVFCVPSVEIPSGASEGFGMVFVEANAMGLPVVSFKTGGIPEAVEDGLTGLLAAPTDWMKLSDHISFLLNNEGTWQSFSEAGIRRAYEFFDLSKQTRELETIYRDVIDQYYK